MLLKHKYILLLLCVVLLGSFLRFYNAENHDRWIDEKFTVRYSTETFSDMIYLLKHDNHPPLYYLTVSSTYSGSNLSLRFTSIIFGILSIPLVFLLGKELFDKRTGILSALFMSINAYMILQSQSARMYTLLICTSLLFVYFYIHYIKHGQKKDLIGFTIAGILSLYTHYFSVFIVLFIFVHQLYMFQSKRLDKKKITWSLSAFVIMFLSFLPWLPIVLGQIARTDITLFWIKDIQYLNVFLYYFTPYQLSIVSYLFFGLFIFLLLFLLRELYYKEKETFIFVSSFLFLIFIAVPLFLQYASWFHQRYFVHFLPFLLIFVSNAILRNKYFFILYSLSYTVLNVIAIEEWFYEISTEKLWSNMTPLW